MKETKAQPANKNILGSLLKTAGMIYGFYQLLNLTIFTGKDFRKPGLTEEQVKLMDGHVKTHILFENAHSHGKALLAAFGVDERKVIDMEKERNMFDDQIKSLPPPLNHKHTK